MYTLGSNYPLLPFILLGIGIVSIWLLEEDS
nr:MAG TPA: hypothetical protein [Caudoviricetes sp.]